MHFNLLCDRLKEVTQETTTLKETQLILKHKSQILKTATAAMQLGTVSSLTISRKKKKKIPIFVHIIDYTQSTRNSFCSESCAFPNATLIYDFK